MGGVHRLTSYDISRSFVIYIYKAKYNKIAATQLKARTEELAVVLCDLFKSVALPISASIEVEIGRLQPLLKTALHYTDKFSKRSYISKLLQGDTMAEKLRLLGCELASRLL